MDDVTVVARAPRGPGRRRPVWWIAAVLVALVVGVLVGRLTAGASRTAPAPRQASTPGPSRVVNGVGVGYAHTRAGVVAALLSHGQLLGDPRVLFNIQRRTQVLALVATPRYAQTFQGQGAAALNQLARGPLGRGFRAGARTVYQEAPLAYRIESYTSNSARVLIWGTVVTGNDQGAAPTATWATRSTTVRWIDGDWRIDTVEPTDGPTPALAGKPASDPAPLFSELNGSRSVTNAP